MNCQPLAGRISFKGNMSGRVSLILAIVAALLFAAAAFLWLHFRASSSNNVVSFTPIAHATGSANEISAEPTPAPGQPAAPAARKAPPEPSFIPQMGEVLQFSASLAKVSNVASLKLAVVDKNQVNGKPTWHFQATAKTQNAL